MNQTATKCNPNPALGAMLKASPASPAEKIRCAACLIFGEKMDAFAARLGRTRPHLSLVIHGKRRESAVLRREIAQVLGVRQSDIWPETSALSLAQSGRPAATHQTRG